MPLKTHGPSNLLRESDHTVTVLGCGGRSSMLRGLLLPQFIRQATKRKKTTSSSVVVPLPAPALPSSNCWWIGLDINTKSTGFATLNPSGSLHSWGTINTAKCSSLLTSAFAIRSVLNSLANTSPPSHISNTTHRLEKDHNEKLEWQLVVEDFMRAFAGRFRTKGLFDLASVNGMVTFAAVQAFGGTPVHLHPTAARGFFSLSKPKDGSAHVKHVVADWAIDQLNLPADYPWVRRPRSGKLDESCYDMTDAYLLARAAAFKAGLENKPPLPLHVKELRYEGQDASETVLGPSHASVTLVRETDWTRD